MKTCEVFISSVLTKSFPSFNGVLSDNLLIVVIVVLASLSVCY